MKTAEFRGFALVRTLPYASVVIYLDNNASTALAGEVLAAMMPYLEATFGNASSAHSAGRAARVGIEDARAHVAALVGAEYPSEVVFTSGGTESIWTALHMAREEGRAPRYVISAVEHAAVFDAARAFARPDGQVIAVPVSRTGALDLDALDDALLGGPAVVSLMLANNETGVISSLEHALPIIRRRGALLHVDAVQAAGKIPVDVQRIGCDYLSISAHKFHGPKGTGAVYVRRNAPRNAFIGGTHEGGLRGGTENVAAIVGLGAAARAALRDLDTEMSRTAALRDRIEAALLSSIEGADVNGDRTARVANTTSVYIPQCDAATLVENLSARGVCVSSGAACSTGRKASHVILAMGHSERRANSSLRISLSKFNTAAEIDRAAAILQETVAATVRLPGGQARRPE